MSSEYDNCARGALKLKGDSGVKKLVFVIILFQYSSLICALNSQPSFVMNDFNLNSKYILTGRRRKVRIKKKK